MRLYAEKRVLYLSLLNCSENVPAGFDPLKCCIALSVTNELNFLTVAYVAARYLKLHIDHQDDLEPNLVRNDIVTEPLYFMEGFRSGPFVSPGSFWSTRGVPRCEELALFY